MWKWFESRIEPYPEDGVEIPPSTFFAFVWFCSRGARGLIAALVALTAAVGIFEASLFGWLGSVVDLLAKVEPRLLFEQKGAELAVIAAAMAVSPILVWMHTLVKRQALAGAFPMLLRWRFHRLMLAQSMSFYQDEFAGRVSAKVMQTALAVRDLWIDLADMGVFVAIYLATMGLLLAGFDRALLLAFGGWLVLYIAELVYFVPRLARAGQKQADARSVMSGRVTDAYANISTVKLFSHSKRESDFAKEAMREFMGTVHGQMRLVSSLEVANHILSMALVGATVGVAIWLWSQGRVGVGAVAAASAMALRLNGISHWIMWSMASIFEQVGTIHDGLGSLASARVVVDKPGALDFKPNAGKIVFENVSFGYGADRMVIDNLSLKVEPGERIGLVGLSGAGKSTLMNLLLRFYEPASGRVMIDGQDVSEVGQESLRAAMGMVTQDTSLLHRTVRENIGYGLDGASEEQIWAAAKMAKADGFIEKLGDSKGAKGLDAKVGERGVKLSGGQRQRIALARVMLKNAPILLLDEATSALDSEVEAAIQESLDELMRGKTVVAIAHRLSTIAAMDRLVVLDKGRVAEQGTHASLLAQGGIYAKLWERQSGGFLIDEQES